MILVSSDDTLTLWDITTGDTNTVKEEINHYAGSWVVSQSFAFSPDGKSLLTSRDDQTLSLWDVATGSLIRRFEGYAASVVSVVFSPDGQSILARSGDNILIMWDVATGDVRRRFEGPTESNLIGRAPFSPNGQTILSASDDGTLILWRNDSLEQLQAWTLQNRYVPDLTCEQRITYDLPSTCVEGTPPSSPTLAPTRTPFATQPSPTVTATP